MNRNIGELWKLCQYSSSVGGEIIRVPIGLLKNILSELATAKNIVSLADKYLDSDDSFDLTRLSEACIDYNRRF